MYKIIIKLWKEERKETIELRYNRKSIETAKNVFYDFSVFCDTVEVFLYDKNWNLLDKKLGVIGKKLIA